MNMKDTTIFTDQMKTMGGVYVLLFYLAQTTRIEIGALGTLAFKRGWYTYHGSAHGGGGIRARVGRHVRRLCNNKKPKWHIDYFREHAILVEAWIAHEAVEYECKWSNAISKLGISSVPVRKMGSTDCKTCPAHIYHLSQRPPTSLLRSSFSSKQIQVVEIEPRPMRKSTREWEPDFWAGRRILERVRLEYYQSGVALPANLSLKKDNSVLRKLQAGSKSASTSKQIKIAHAIESLIETHGEPATMSEAELHGWEACQSMVRKHSK